MKSLLRSKCQSEWRWCVSFHLYEGGGSRSHWHSEWKSAPLPSIRVHSKHVRDNQRSTYSHLLITFHQDLRIGRERVMKGDLTQLIKASTHLRRSKQITGGHNRFNGVVSVINMNHCNNRLIGIGYNIHKTKVCYHYYFIIGIDIKLIQNRDSFVRGRQKTTVARDELQQIASRNYFTKLTSLNVIV